MVSIQVKAGKDSTRLFGAVTSEQIGEAIKEQIGVGLERKQILLVAPIKRLGEFPVEINIHREVEITVKVRVFDPEHVEDEKKKAADVTAEVIAEELEPEPEVTASEAESE